VLFRSGWGGGGGGGGLYWIGCSASNCREDENMRGRTLKFANSPPCACRGSTGQKP